MVYATCYRLVRSQSDAEDLSQEVFIEVFRSLHMIRKENDISGWIFKIAYNKSLSFLRKRNPVKLTNSVNIDSSTAELDKLHKRAESDSPHHSMEQAETRRIVFQAVDQLPDNQKKVILLHKFENYSQKEICEQLGLSLVSVESLIYRAKTNLRKSLFNYFKHYSK